MPDSNLFQLTHFIFFCFLSCVSCHFLGYQCVLSHFQVTASNLSAPEVGNQASGTGASVTRSPQRSGVAHLQVSQVSGPLILILGSNQGHANSEQVMHSRLVCRPRGRGISPSYALARPLLESCFRQRALITPYASEKVYRSCHSLKTGWECLTL